MDATQPALDPLLSEHIATDILAHLQVALLDVDADLRVVAHTPGLVPYLGEPSARTGDMVLSDLFPELIGMEADLASVARGDSPRFDLPMINRLEAGGPDRRYFSLTALPHPEAADRLLLLVQDVTTEGRLRQQVMQQLNEVRLLRSRLETANAALTRLNEEKSAFLRMAAHDLRAPLAIVRGYVDLVLHDALVTGSEEITGHLQTVLRRAIQMAGLIDNLLDIEKIESGEVGLEPAALDLAQLVRQVASGFLPMAAQKGITLSWEMPPSLSIVVDPDRLAQVLNNLIDNAIKFTPPGGEVRITARQDDDQISVAVTDTGPGISEQDQARLFQRFFRTDASRQRGIAGTGLGLSIARAIVEQHGGQVACLSQLGEGSTFRFTLPFQGA